MRFNLLKQMLFFFFWNGLKVIIVKNNCDSGTRLELQPIIDSALWQYYKLSS